MTNSAHQLIEHFFRHEYGRLVAVLTQRVGLRQIDFAEDAAQGAIAQALQHWARHGIPDNPGGWLFRVATRIMIDRMRHEAVVSKQLEALRESFSDRQDRMSNVGAASLDRDFHDEQISLLMACCHHELPQASSVALALKVIGGFSIDEIAHGLLTSSANIQKRITRAKDKLRESESLSEGYTITDRIDSAILVIYLMFNEGYFSFHNEVAIRRDLCVEAMRLASLLAIHPEGTLPKVHALQALMAFQFARLETRTDASGNVLLLEEQDRTQWNWQFIREGMDWMQLSAKGTEITRFHVEAAIAWEHCRAERFIDTDWTKICELYDLLLGQVASPIQWLNRAVAESYRNGPRAGLKILNALRSEDRPTAYPLWHAVFGFLFYRDGDLASAKQHWQLALQQTHSRAEQELLRKRIEACQ